MRQQGLAGRVDTLEEQVSVLEQLPARMDRLESQIVQLRTEMRGEFSAVRAEAQALKGQLRVEIREGDEETRRHMRVLHEEVIGRLRAIQEGQASSHPTVAPGSARRRPKR